MPRTRGQAAAIAAFQKPLRALNKSELERLARALDINDVGTNAVLRQRIQVPLQENYATLHTDPIYAKLYPQNYQPPQQLHSPARSLHHSDDSTWQGFQSNHGDQDHHSVNHDNHDYGNDPPADNIPGDEHERRDATAMDEYPDYHQHGFPLMGNVQDRNAVMSNSKRKRPFRTTGAEATGIAYIVPDSIRKKFAEQWSVHVPLTYLTNDYCTQGGKGSKSTQDVLTIDTSSGQPELITTSKMLSTEGELTMSFDHWFQAWQRLLELIGEFLPEELQAWDTHFHRILNHPLGRTNGLSG